MTRCWMARSASSKAATGSSAASTEPGPDCPSSFASSACTSFSPILDLGDFRLVPDAVDQVVVVVGLGRNKAVAQLFAFGPESGHSRVVYRLGKQLTEVGHGQSTAHDAQHEVVDGVAAPVMAKQPARVAIQAVAHAAAGPHPQAARAELDARAEMLSGGALASGLALRVVQSSLRRRELRLAY